MQQKQNLVLIGGGHSHAIVLDLLSKISLGKTDLILISDVIKTPYSGMLPGHIAGYYTYDESHINLKKLADRAGAKLILDRAIGLDLKENKVLCKNGDRIDFDLLSIDIGSTPATISVPGAKEYAISIKPVPNFLAEWNRLLATLPNSLTIGIVGGGAGGVELALNAERRLHDRVENWQIHIFDRNERILTNHNQSVSKILSNILVKRGIKLHLLESVAEVTREGIICKSGLNVRCDRIFWVTQASAPDWIAKSGLITDSRGFILVKDTLQSLSHPHIFAAGDIATIQNNPRPKAGVFAVRQGRPLYENLVRRIAGKELKSYIPQQKYLSLIGTGKKSAIASRGSFAWESPLLWLWKDYLDRSFMNRFQ
ncbi:MAG: FAD-dependent oxidoreductase [Prochloraceae cyanobacterium]|nr:FAD-dependent oxidoreductase [Prochloraceae cyanobacterium]